MNRSRGWSRAATVVPLVLVSALVVWAVVSRQTAGVPPGGDPGGRILNALRSTSEGVPPGVTVIDSQYDETHVDSCDGMAGTYGWDPPVVQIDFAWTGTPTTLIQSVGAGMAKEGWSGFHVDQPPLHGEPPSARWSKRLFNRSTATATLQPEGYGHEWTLLASAPADGTAPSGC